MFAIIDRKPAIDSRGSDPARAPLLPSNSASLSSMLQQQQHRRRGSSSYSSNKTTAGRSGGMVTLRSSNNSNHSSSAGHLQFTDVSFTYPTRPDVQVLCGISFQCSAGDTIALVGPSGSGKTTVVSLIQRFYDPCTGVISLDGVPLPSIPSHRLHRCVAAVSQEPTLFASSIKENILYGRCTTEADAAGKEKEEENNAAAAAAAGLFVAVPEEEDEEEELRRVAKEANALDFITQFPDSFKTVVGENGVQLSGGQKQRVAIARAIFVNPRILLLDEATSALDAESEHQVQEALDRMMSTRTTLVIAHRLSTVRNATKILVMNKGRIVECGTHNELLQSPGGHYKQLIARQLQGLS